MTNRREFLQAGIAASMLPMAVAGSSLAPAEGEPGSAFYKVIFDERFPASVAYAREMERNGAPVHAIRGDITALWYHDLDARWKQSSVTIAGLTAHGPLFCLERLAWDNGMRVLSRTEQDSRDQDGEALISWVIGPKERT